MKYNIDINSCYKISKFINILKDNNIKATLICDDNNYRVQATELGALGTLEWKGVSVECDNNIKELIEDFIIKDDG